MYREMHIPFYVFMIFTGAYLLLGVGLGWVLRWINRP